MSKSKPHFPKRTQEEMPCGPTLRLRRLRDATRPRTTDLRPGRAPPPQAPPKLCATGFRARVRRRSAETSPAARRCRRPSYLDEQQKDGDRQDTAEQNARRTESDPVGGFRDADRGDGEREVPRTVVPREEFAALTLR